MSDNSKENAAGLKNLLAQRRQKLNNLIEAGIKPFGCRYDGKQSTVEIISSYKDDVEGQKVKTAGRILTFRDMGKASFAHIADENGKIQLYAQRDVLEEGYKVYKKLDIGDIIGVEGELFRTKKGEVSIRVSEFTVLAKSLRPLPEKFHGLKDLEQRYRQRYLDLISNEESKDIFIKRIKIISEIRRYLEDQGYMEVETPMMHPIAGGAAARPFITHYNALDTDMYMRIATELYLKQLLVGGMEKIFEINRNFRNEGLSKRHNPEFTCMELYQAFGNCETMMELIEGLIIHLAEKIIGTLEIAHGEDKVINLKGPWLRKSYKDLICEHIATNWFELSKEEKVAQAAKIGCHVSVEMDELEITHEVYEKHVEPHLIQPTFVTRLPRHLVPLAKACEDDAELVDVYELIVNGQELSPGYTELNDPIEQRKRFEEQATRTAGTEEEESGKIDENFLMALEHGMPPTGGLGIGIDRLVMLLTGAPTIRDVILFPQLKQKND